jgi:ABC-2 type transport system ATP-binding protein
MDAFRFQQIVYDVPDADFRRNLDQLIALLDIGRLLDRQLRALSLGEKMRCGLAHKLLYRPRVLFLDEPTIGMDVTGTAGVRRFIADYAVQTGATILLTSHYMADVETLCRRVILIDKGQLRYDGDLAGLATAISPYKLIRVALVAAAGGTSGPAGPAGPAGYAGTTSTPDHANGNGAITDWTRFGPSVEVAESQNGKVTLRVRREDAPTVAARLLAELSIADLSVENPPLESVIDRVYREGVTSSGTASPNTTAQRVTS